MIIKRISLIAITLALTSACVMDQAELDHKHCIEYGFAQGTKGYSECRMKLDERHAEDRRAREIMEHEQKLEREKTDRVVGTVGAIDGLFGGKKKKNRECKVAKDGKLKCGRICMEGTFGEVECGNECMKDDFGHVKCGNNCASDSWGKIVCN